MIRSKQIDNKNIEEKFSEAVRLFRDRRYAQSESSFAQLIVELQNLLNISSRSMVSKHNDAVIKKMLSQCFLNKAVCLLNQQQKDEKQQEIMQCLQSSVKMNNVNYWAYFNMFSLHYQTFDYHKALESIKCCLSCLYLTKSVLSKDLSSKSGEKDISKAIGLCLNNYEAELVRLIMHLKQAKWKKGLNEIEILEEIIGQNEHLNELKNILDSVQSSMTTDQQKSICQRAMKIVLTLKNDIKQQKLVAIHDEEQQKNIIKAINERVYEFNELVNQVNELGHVFGVFNLKSISQFNSSNKKILIISNLIPFSNPFQQEKQWEKEKSGQEEGNNQGQSKEEKQTEQNGKQKVNRQEQAEKVQLPAQNVQKFPQIKISESSHQFQNNQSLFDYTKSNNEYIQNSKKQAQIEGNLLSSVKATKKPMFFQQHQDQGNSNFNLESIVLANMRKKEMQIRCIQSQIRFDTEQGPLYHTYNNHHLGNEDQDLLLDSAFDKSFNNKSVRTTGKKDLPEHVTNSKKSKIEEKKMRIYPVGEIYKFIQIWLDKFQFKDPNQQKAIDIYCVLEVKGTMGKSPRFTSNRKESKLAGFKQKIEWEESLGYLQIPQEPAGLEIKLMKSETGKFFDTCLGSGEIEMTSSGLNKFPIYSGSRQIGLATIRLLLREQSLASSYKQSSLSSSHRTESQNSIS